jgi:hypothetical protein
MRITPKNWGEFQHYKDRDPPWIKLHKKLLTNYEFFQLPVASRALAPCLWLLASEYEGGVIDASLAKLAFRLHMSEAELAEALQPLLESDLFEIDSEALAPCKQSARLEETEAQVQTQLQAEEKEPDANASADPRTKLFNESLKTLARITGKTPDSCRALVGRWLKTVEDEAIHVIAAIEDADRNRIADPVAWITKSLKPRGGNGQNQGSVIDAADRLLERVRAFDEPAPGIRDDARPPPIRAISAR